MIEFHEGDMLEGNHYIRQEDRDKEAKDMESMYSRHIKIDDRPLKAYLFPSQSAGKKTTGVSIRGKKGNVFHVCLRFKTEEQIKRDLSGWGWPTSDRERPTEENKKKRTTSNDHAAL